jgi:DnaK suppressor protein
MPLSDRDIRLALNNRRAELLQSSADHKDERAPVELDQQSVGRLSRMDALQVQAMAKESERRRLDEVRRIDAALNRLDEGEYGYCVTCGEDIAPKRLAFDRSIPTCIDCARGGKPA